MSRLTRDGTAEPVSRDQILRHARGQGNVHFPCSADHEQDWQPYPVDPYSAICDDHTSIHTYIHQKTIATVSDELESTLRRTEASTLPDTLLGWLKQTVSYIIIWIHVILVSKPNLSASLSFVI